MTIGAAYAAELEMESAATRRVLERVPEHQLAWRPHPKSMSLGQLALHVATLPQMVVGFVTGDELDFSAAAGGPPSPSSRAALLDAFEESLRTSAAYFESLSDERAAAAWRLKSGERLLFTAPRAGVLRSLLFNHWYHHRGQLLVYLRLLDVSVPSVYGPTADENPFAE
jgi:uncharacterized damage-inducible protein DinB